MDQKHSDFRDDLPVSSCCDKVYKEHSDLGVTYQ